MNILDKLREIDPNFERDELGCGYGIRSTDGEFVRVKPFWISYEEIEDKFFNREICKYRTKRKES